MRRISLFGKRVLRSENSNKIRILQSTTTNPVFNLATEDWLYKEGQVDNVQTLFLWRNSPTVVIGRHQNPWRECNLGAMDRDNVVLMRRSSGGGAVYQDLGNTCFTYLSPRNQYSKERNTDIIIRSLRPFGVEAVASGRNDIHLITGQKISGSAMRQSSDRALHHGTLLINVDMTSFDKYLTPNKEKLKSKGVSSVAARVQNLQSTNASITHDSLTQSLAKEFQTQYAPSQPMNIEMLDTKNLEAIPSLAEAYRSLQDWSWRYGFTPEFNVRHETRFEWGVMDVNINSNEGRIKTITIFSDCLFPLMVDDIAASLKGATYDERGITQSLAPLHTKYENTDPGKCIAQFQDWLIGVCKK